MDIRPADLPLLVSLNALLQERNVTRAAARLNITQPALSAQLSRLRAMFQDPLLVPSETGRGMVPTARALELAAPLADALRQLGTVVQEPGGFDPRTSDRTFVIAANDNALVMLGLRLVHAVLATGGPRMRLSFRSVPAEESVQGLEGGELDLVLGAARTLPEPLKSRPLASERYLMAQRKDHPRGAQPVTLDEYCALQHVLVSTSGGFRGFVDDHLQTLGRERRVAISVPQYNVVPTILAQTELVSTLPARFLRSFTDRLDLFELPFETPAFALSAAWHPRSDTDPAHRWLRQLLEG